jgi:hypothetical protein
MESKKPAPEQVAVSPTIVSIDPKLSKLKVAFLYILIGGLVVSALISVMAILIGQFNEVVLKALLTTFIFMSHSLLIIALISADRYNTIGKALFPTTIFVTIIANMLTTTLGTWGVWNNDVSWRAFLLYMLIIGSAFIVTAALHLRTTHRNTNIAIYATVSCVSLLTIVLIPWVFAHTPSDLGSFYYRLIGALTILAATALSLSVIFNRIAVSQHPELTKINQTRVSLPGGMLAIYIVIGVIAAYAWSFGLFALIGSAASVDRARAPYTPYSDSQYNNNL